MATSVSVNTKTDLVSVESLSYMRPIVITFKATDCKPKARMYALFDGVGVNEFITPKHGVDAGIAGGRIFADEYGVIEGTFSVPSMTFNTGVKTFKLTENPRWDSEEINGSLYGYCIADFTSTGIKQIYQNTITTTITNTVTITVVDPVVPASTKSDPLAQSFFTYGVTGGCFITSIDLYFYAKSEEIPLIVEIREMVNGYPGPSLVNEYARVSKTPSEIKLSDDASVPTNFKFETPFYLEEDKDYCFVVLSNSKDYYMFTCTMGERSFETDRIVFEQPYLGSLFKSQNNDTWTAEQYEDIKFKIYKAEFDIDSPGFVNMYSTSPPTYISSSCLSTTASSNVIRAELTWNHNLDVGNKVALAVDSRGKYNGIAASNLAGVFNVTSVLTPRVFEFVASASATSTGTIDNGGMVTHCVIDNKGTGYDESDPPIITFQTAPIGGVTATGTAVIELGKITSIKITNPGSGYITAPTVDITGATGSGASARASLDVKFAITTNRGYSMVTPGLSNVVASGTAIDATYNWTKGNYEGGNITTYTAGDAIKFNLSQKNWLPLNAILASGYNENSIMSGQRSAVLSLNLSSTNKNLSPYISKKNAIAMFSGHLINNQPDEDLLSTNPNGSVDSIEVVSGGVGYTVAPTVTLVNQYGCPGTGATASASISGGVVIGVSITNPGTGYLKPPTVVFTGDCSVVATATSYLNDFNSELQPNSGTAKARYLTQINYLSGATDSARCFVEAYSGHNSSVDVYIRTSLKSNGVVHKEQNWQIMNCDTERNKSEYDGQTLDYEFYLDSMEQFDTYDIKIVMRSTNPIDVPWLKNLRAILTV